MGWNLLLPVFAAAILGGIGRPYGAIAGGHGDRASAEEAVGSYPLDHRRAAAVNPGYKTARGLRADGGDADLAAVPGLFKRAGVLMWRDQRLRPDGLYLIVSLLTMGGHLRRAWRWG